MILREWRIFARMLIQFQIYSTNIRFYELLTENSNLSRCLNILENIVLFSLSIFKILKKRILTLSANIKIYLRRT